MNCSTGNGGKVKGVIIGIKNSDGDIDNTGGKKKTPGTGTRKSSVFW
jgi:hypothetical protein